jgi:hypothetical protein
MDHRKQATPPAAREPAKPQGIPVQGICAIIGAVICVVLNVVTDGKVPGGYTAGVVGGGIGWVVGIGIEKFILAKK